MATRSLIAMVNPDSSVHSIYCHYDGNLGGVGCMLHYYYNSSEQINRLMELGHLVELKPLVAAPEESETPQEDEITVAYHRDKGHDLNVEVFADTDDWVRDLYIQEVEYAYLFIRSKWVYFSIKNEWNELLQTHILCVSKPKLLEKELEMEQAA